MIASPPRPRIVAVGSASWDDLIVVDRYPAPGGYSVVRDRASMPGGTTSNTAVALAHLGAEVAIVATVGDDEQGSRLRAAMVAAGVDDRWLATRAGAATDRATIVVSGTPPTRTIFWHVGVRLGPGDPLDLDAIYNSEVVVLDVDNAALRWSIGESDARTEGRAMILGTVTYLVGGDLAPADALALALRDDVIVGNEEQIVDLTDSRSLEDAAAVLRQLMRTTNLSACAITRGAHGCAIVTDGDRWDFPAWSVEVIDTTAAGDAFAGALAYGLARGWEWARIGHFANAVGALATRALGAQSALPSIEEVAALTGMEPAALA